MDFQIPDTPTKSDDEFVIAKTREYNARFVPSDYAPLSVYCRDTEGNIVGGLTGKTYWSYLDIEFLWVDEAFRKQGLGGEIVRQAEAVAAQRGCKYAMLDTYEFQALGFYQKQGYEKFGELNEFCGKYTRYFLRKAL